MRLPGVMVVDETGPVEIGTPDGVAEWAGLNLGELHALAKRQRVSQIWLTPSALKHYGLPLRLEPGEGLHHPFIDAPGLHTPRGQVLGSWLSVWGGEHMLEVSVPSWDRGSPFWGIDFAPLLLGELLEFSEATGILWKRSGAITSDAWLREHFARNHLLKPTDYPDLAQTIVEDDLREMGTAAGSRERKASTLLAFDANAMYLSAMSSLALPVGGFIQHHALGSVSEVGVPGYWRSGERWMTSPTVNFRAPVDIDEGYGWTESHRYLEPLYRALRDGRTMLLKRPDSAALEALKQVYRQGIGRLGSTARTAGTEDPLYQPYWRHAVIAEARTRLQRRIASLGQAPIAIDVDCLYFLTSGKGASSPEMFASRIALPLDDHAGHFKFAGAMPGALAREILSGGFIMKDDRKLTGLAALREGIKA